MLYIPYPFKRCTFCKQEFPTNLRYFHRHRAKKDGLTAKCRTCNIARAVEWQRANPEKAKINQRKSIAKRPEKEKNRIRIYRQSHRDKIRLYKKEYNQTDQGKFIRAKAQNHYRESQHGKLKHRIQEHNRNAAKREAEGRYKTDDILAQYKRQKGRCYYCGKELGDQYHIEHVVPLSRGGSNGPDNIVVACPHCNFTKNDKLPHEWPEGGRLC